MKKGTDLKLEWDSFILDGSEPAYYQLYTHYHNYFFYIGIKRGALAAKIGDCLHDLFLYIYENREKLSNIRDHHSYLVTAFLRSLFRNHHFSAEESADFEVVEDVKTMPAADHQLLLSNTNDQVRQVLQNYIDKLSVSQSRMIYEKFYLGLSYEEIALAHQITVRTAYNTIFRAIDKLRKQMGENKLASLLAAITALSLIIYAFL